MCMVHYNNAENTRKRVSVRVFTYQFHKTSTIEMGLCVYIASSTQAYTVCLCIKHFTCAWYLIVQHTNIGQTRHTKTNRTDRPTRIAMNCDVLLSISVVPSHSSLSVRSSLVTNACVNVRLSVNAKYSIQSNRR